MANLTFNEKQLIESVFEMRGGYLLDFSNSDFEEFMKDVVSYNIYNKYPGLSKAKMFRAFIADESQSYVGKAIALLLSYMKGKGMINESNKEKITALSDLSLKLLGRISSNNNSKEGDVQVVFKEETVDFDQLNSDLLAIESIATPQAKGYAFEKYLTKLFQQFGLEPRASYRTEYDQIDGSFMLEGNTVLLEAKYKSSPIPKDDLILFTNKVASKSHYSRGIFITCSRVDEKAIQYFSDKSARIIIMTVEELFLMCQSKYSIVKVLQSKFRTLDENGMIYKNILTIM